VTAGSRERRCAEYCSTRQPTTPPLFLDVILDVILDTATCTSQCSTGPGDHSRRAGRLAHTVTHADCTWILDSGGAGRGAWQGGVIHRFMAWARAHGALPSVTMGASAGGYAAADVATGTENTVTKGWTWWGTGRLSELSSRLPPGWRARGLGSFRAHLHGSVHYVMAETELAALFDPAIPKKLLIFTTRISRRDGRPFATVDMARHFVRSATRKLPPALKYIPAHYCEDLVVFATPLPSSLRSEWVRPLEHENFHRVLEASCLVPLAMGAPIPAKELTAGGTPSDDRLAVFMDGGFTAKMPIRLFMEDPRYQPVAAWARTTKTIIFCCDPGGSLWETSSRLQRLNDDARVRQAIADRTLLVISPDHPIEAGFLCTDNDAIMQTFRRGQEQGDRLLRSDDVNRFLETS
jgi:predicted acylesterase/phospholipase RssA